MGIEILEVAPDGKSMKGKVRSGKSIIARIIGINLFYDTLGIRYEGV